ncbi:18332_t:CDS:1, partial [Gigaspora rosea]
DENLLKGNEKSNYKNQQQTLTMKTYETNITKKTTTQKAMTPKRKK